MILALIVLAAPLMLTNSYVAVDGIDVDVVEAARGMGLRAVAGALTRVELPLALPLHLRRHSHGRRLRRRDGDAGGVVGGGSLGDIIFNQATYFLSGVVGAAILVSLLAFAADFTFAGLQRLLTPRGLRYAASAHLPEEEPPSVLEAAAA